MVNTVDQLKAEEFVKQAILKYDPSFDLSVDSPFYDLFVRFFQNTTLPEIIRIYNNMIDSRSLLNTNSTVEDYDRLLVILNFPRKASTYAKVYFNLSYSSPEEITVRTTDVYTIDNKTFNPVSNKTYTVSDWVNDGSSYGLELLLQAKTAGDAGNVGINVEVTTPYNESTSFIKAYTTTVDTIGFNAETNEQVLTRIQDEYGLESLINARGINFILNKYFPNDIQSVYIAGYSEIEQKRDIRRIEIPKRIARVYFNNKINLTIPVNTIMYYNDNTEIKYTFREAPVTISSTSTRWKEFAGGGYYLELDIELLDKYNIQGFREDIPITIPYFLTNFSGNFTAAMTRTTYWNEEEANIRIGAHTDIYIKTGTIREKVRVFVPLNSNGIVEIPAEYQPILKIHRIDEIDINNNLKEVEIFTLLVDKPELRFSSRDNVKVYMKPSLVGTNVIVDMTYAPKIKEIQAFCDNPVMRVIAEDVLVRFYNPLFVGIYSIVTGSSSLDSVLKDAATSYVNSVNTGSIILSELVSKLGQEVPELRAIFMDSLQMIGQQEMPDGSYQNIRGDEVLNPYVDESIGVTSRNTTFLLEAVEFDYK